MFNASANCPFAHTYDDGEDGDDEQMFQMGQTNAATSDPKLSQQMALGWRRQRLCTGPSCLRINKQLLLFSYTNDRSC